MQQLVANQHQQTANEGLIVLKQFLTDAINSVVSRSFAKGWLSVDRTVAFITIGGNDSLETLRSAVTIHPASPELHDLYMNAVSASADYKKQQAYEWLLELLERNCKSVFLYTRTFERYRDVLLLNGEEFNAINAKYQSAIAHWDAIGSVNDDLSAPIVQSYLNWLVNRIGVEASRPYYNRSEQLRLFYFYISLDWHS
jgi:hypothetical protein